MAELVESEEDIFNNKQFIANLIKERDERLSFVTKSGKSIVWNRFQRVVFGDIETVYVKCVNCDDIQKQTSFSGTSGLLKHRCRQLIGSDVLSDDCGQGFEEKLKPSHEVYQPFEDMTHFSEAMDEDCDELSFLNDRQFFVDLVKNGDKRVTFGRHRGKSNVWRLFERIFYNRSETEFVKCKQCHAIQKHTNTYGTGGLLRHRCGSEFIELSDTPEEEKSDLATDWSAVELDPINDKNNLIEMVRSKDSRLRFVDSCGKSEAWLRFQRIFLDELETQYVKCKQCHSIQKHTSSGGTQGLLRHKCRQTDDSDPQPVRSTRIESKFELKSDYKNTITDEKALIKQLREENKTLKLIVEKSLNMIDNCLCVNKYNTKQRKDINVLINSYNKYVFSEQMTQNDENIETNNVLESEKQSDCDPTTGANEMKILYVFRNKFVNKQRVSNCIKNKYIKKKRLACSFCDKSYRIAVHLKQHVDIVHLNKKNFACDWPGCDERFYKRLQLRLHLIKCHTKDNPFKCDQCKYGTTYRALLLRHKRIHSGDKVLSCAWPGCEFKTNYEQGLKAHKLRHSDERPWKCSWPQCTDKFRQSHHLKAHLLKHTGEKPYECPAEACGRRFASRQAMRFHSEKVHNNVITG